jgi:predicted nucleotidyltransferase
MNDEDFARDRDRVLEALAAFAAGDADIRGLWLQGSLARGDADALSDIDAYLAVEDAAFDAVFARREAILGSLRPVIAWSDATTPGLKAVHACSTAACGWTSISSRRPRLASRSGRPCAWCWTRPTWARVLLRAGRRRRR